MRSFLGVPIVLRGVPYGNLYLTEKRGADAFTADDVHLATLLAAQAAVAIENARLYEAARSLVVAARVARGNRQRARRARRISVPFSISLRTGSKTSLAHALVTVLLPSEQETLGSQPSQERVRRADRLSRSEAQLEERPRLGGPAKRAYRLGHRRP